MTSLRFAAFFYCTWKSLKFNVYNLGEIMKAIKSIRVEALLCLTALLFAGAAGCQTEPEQPSGFIPNPEKMQKYDLLPFQKAWKSKDFVSSKYNAIMVLPVFTQDQVDKSWMEESNVRTWMDKESQDVKDFAEYTAAAFRNAVKQSKNYQLTDKPGPQTLILELALVKIVPEKPVLGAAKNLATPIASSFNLIALAVAPVRAAAESASDSPLQASVAIEGRIRDSVSKKIVATFADREKQVAAIVNLQDFTAYGNLRQIVDMWANEFLQILDKHPLETGVAVESEKSNLKIINY
jgi:hypothetical protein